MDEKNLGRFSQFIIIIIIIMKKINENSFPNFFYRKFTEIFIKIIMKKLTVIFGSVKSRLLINENTNV